MSVFTSEINNWSDLAKNFLFQIIIVPEEGTALANLFKELGGAEQFILKSKTGTIPGKSFEGMLEEHYMGTKIQYPGKAVVDGDMEVTFDEHQDLLASKMLTAWQNLIFDNSIEEDGGDITSSGMNLSGGAASNFLREYSAKVHVVLFDSTKKRRLPYGWILYKVLPTNVSNFTLDFNGSEKVTRSVTFHYQTWQMIDSEKM